MIRLIPHLLISVLAVSASTPLQPKRIEPPRPEKEYQKEFAAKVGGKVEVRMGDGTRCDVVTETHAIEVDFGYKWVHVVQPTRNCHNWQLARTRSGKGNK